MDKTRHDKVDGEARNIVVLSLGAGVQSSVLALMACRGELLPKPDHIMFADTGNEPAAVYEHLEWLSGVIEESGIPLHIVSGGNMIEDIKKTLHDTSAKTGRVGQPPFYVKEKDSAETPDPATGVLWRKCTSEYKIQPQEKKTREILGLEKGQHMPKDIKVTRMLGISMDEVSRMKPSRHKWETIIWPLIEKDMTRWDCYIWLKKNKYPIPPRSACLVCPYHNNDYWRDMKQNNPEEFTQVCEFDDELRRGRIPGTRGDVYIHKTAIPLRDVDLSTDIDKGQQTLNLWGGECDGICGT